MTQKFAGNGASKVFLKDVKGMIVSTKGTSQTVAAAKTLAGWQALINPATSAAIAATYVNLSRGFEEKTPAPEMTTANTGFKEKTKDYEQEFTAFGLMSYEDYKTWFGADAKEYDFTLVLNDGKLMHALTSAGLMVGFGGRMYVKFGLPTAGGTGKTQACQFDVIFDDVMYDYTISVPSFTRKELEALVPVGVNLEVVTAYSAADGTVTLKATKRATNEPYAGFATAAEFEVVSLSTDVAGAATAIDVTSAALGIYVLTFLNTAAKLTGDFEIQGVKVATSHITYLTNVLNVPI